MRKPTEKMIHFANKIAWGLGMDNPPEQIKEDFKECSIFIQENKNKFYKRKYEHDKWMHDMEIKHRTNKYNSEYSMPYAEGIAAYDYGIFPWGNS